MPGGKFIIPINTVSNRMRDWIENIIWMVHYHPKMTVILSEFKKTNVRIEMLDVRHRQWEGEWDHVNNLLISCSSRVTCPPSIPDVVDWSRRLAAIAFCKSLWVAWPVSCSPLVRSITPTINRIVLYNNVFIFSFGNSFLPSFVGWCNNNLSIKTNEIHHWKELRIRTLKLTAGSIYQSVANSRII